MRRWRFFVLSLLLVGILDAARSVSTHWRAGSGPPADRSPSAALVVEPRPAKPVYAIHCARCHGDEGKGDGPAAAALHPRPRDFTRGIFKLKSTPSGQAPTRDDVLNAVRRGLPGTSMPGFEGLLSEAEMAAVVEDVRSFGPHAAWESKDRAVPIPDGEGRADHGAELFVSLGCPACHAKDGRGDGAAASALKDVWMQPSPPRDLTAPWTFRGGAGREAVFASIAHGFSGTPMPGYLEATSAQDILDVVAYIASMARVPAWGEGGRLDESAAVDVLKRGRYLVSSGMCASCHSPASGSGSELAGGVRIDAGAHGIYFASNLTSDIDSGIGGRKVEELALAIQSGHTRARRLNFLAMPWIIYGSLAPADAIAIATYLKTVPAVRNFAPRPLHYGFVETVLRKLTYSWPGALPTQVRHDRRNFGAQQAAAGSFDAWLIWAQLAALVLAVISLFRVPAAAEDEGSRSSAVLVSVLVCGVVFGTAALVVYWYPALNAVPGKPMVAAFAASVPPVREEGLTEGQVALLRRGRYLYLTSSCAYCHNGNGSGGGRVSGHGIGEVYAANLTNHPTGLAGRADALVLRALVSGISAAGRVIDPSVMPWDRYANLSADDQHALVAFLRSLPGIDKQVPGARPPGAGDADGVTFWTGE